MTSVLPQNDARKTSDVLALDLQQIQQARSGHRCEAIARPVLGTADTVAESKDAHLQSETFTGRGSPLNQSRAFSPSVRNRCIREEWTSKCTKKGFPY